MLRWWTLLAAVVSISAGSIAGAQVFTVGEKSATADIKTDFKPTKVDLPHEPMTERGRRELVRDLQSEQGFAHRILPLGTILTLNANGNLTPGAEEYRKAIYKKGQAAAAGDRVMITALEVRGNAIQVDLNGGPYVKHRILRHFSIGIGGAEANAGDPGETATGCRVTLVFEGGVPEVSAPEVKALLEPVIDFGVKTGEQAYADTLPTPVKDAIASHEVLVGMTRRMVIASLGAPESKVREQDGDVRYEEWIYGHLPQTVKFVRFVGDKVTLVKFATAGKAIEAHTEPQMEDPDAIKIAPGVVVGDTHTGREGSKPTLRTADDPLPAATVGPAKVQYPPEHKPAPQAIPE